MAAYLKLELNGNEGGRHVTEQLDHEERTDLMEQVIFVAQIEVGHGLDVP